MSSWKPIKNYPNYIISDSGIVKNITRNKILSFDCGQYLRVTLYREGSSKKFLVHRLVAETFIPNPNNFPEVNHIDGNKRNNSVYNLEWVSHSENLKHAYKNGLAHSTEFSKFLGKRLKPLLEKKIGMFTLDNKLVRTFNSVKEASSFTGASSSCISSAANGRQRTCRNFIWKYL